MSKLVNPDDNLPINPQKTTSTISIKLLAYIYLFAKYLYTFASVSGRLLSFFTVPLAVYGAYLPKQTLVTEYKAVPKYVKYLNKGAKASAILALCQMVFYPLYAYIYILANDGVFLTLT